MAAHGDATHEQVESMTSSTYREAGVDLELYQQAMQRLPQFLRQTHTPGVMELDGGFAGLFRLNEAGPFTDPVLVSGTDGVGTKLKVAVRAGRCDSVGIDLVAMCVNDCLCLGAQPLFFLDYIALGKDDPQLITELVSGVSSGCRQAGAALIGGETAIMPDVYADGEFDMAGFCVGVVERSDVIYGTQRIEPGDVLIGLASSGLHSNGYSLVRRAVFERSGLAIDHHFAALDATVADTLLEPTRIYANEIAHILEAGGSGIHGIAHITGGGLQDNVGRILPDRCQAVIDRASWTQPPVFAWLMATGDIDRDEMYRVFNMGIGMVVVCTGDIAGAVSTAAARTGCQAWHIGQVTSGPSRAVFSDTRE